MILSTAVITGAGSGLGRALALDLTRRGAAVVLGDLNEVGLAETVRLVEAAGGRARAVVGDVRDPASHEALLAEARASFGDVDLWVNNAGVAAAGPVGDLPLEDWRWLVDINLMGVVNGCHVAAPALRARRQGAILNVASAAGLVHMPGMGAYNAAKAAVVALSETMYAELRPQGVGVTVLCPTFFQTHLLDTSRTTDDAARSIARKLMARAKMTADDVARAAIDDVLAGRLHSVPMADGRWMWRLRRWMPAWFQRQVASRAEQVARRR
jgi:NAD(P)-dependent dehydrogenase (short-subunit alcohol dehydrogenase family)